MLDAPWELREIWARLLPAQPLVDRQLYECRFVEVFFVLRNGEVGELAGQRIGLVELGEGLLTNIPGCR